MNRYYKSLIIVIIAIVVAAFFWRKDAGNTDSISEVNGGGAVSGIAKRDDQQAATANESNKGGLIIASKNDEVEKEDKGVIEKKIAGKILIDVPFSSQAPLGKWDAFHEEACEETSLVMLKYYFDKKTLTPEIAEKEIQTLIAYEIKKYGNYEDSDAGRIVEIANDFYGIENLKVVYDFRKDDLEKQLALGKPIIVPAAGRLLGNPNFKAPGPLYHNLVLIGYDGNEIITNDPGTRKGKEYRYSLDVLYNAIHDFPGKPEEIKMGRKAMIIVE